MKTAKRKTMKLTDAGKVACGFSGESNDCAVRALAISANLTYAQAHDILKWLGRIDQDFTRGDILMALAELLGAKFFTFKNQRTIDYMLMKTGTYFCFNTFHAWAVKDGIVYDSSPLSPDFPVQWYIKL